jgi:hypothetical protein
MFCSPLSLRPCAVVLILVLLCLVVAPSAACAATEAPAVAVAAAPLASTASEIMSNRGHMIQVTCVVVVIGIVLLTYRYR